MVSTESHLGRTRVNWETALWHTCGESSRLGEHLGNTRGHSSYVYSYVLRPL